MTVASPMPLDWSGAARNAAQPSGAKPAANTLQVNRRTRGAANTALRATQPDPSFSTEVTRGVISSRPIIALHYADFAPIYATSGLGDSSLQKMTETFRDQEMSGLVTPVKIIGFLTAAIAAMLPIFAVLVGVIYSNLRGDLDDLKKSNIEIVKTVGSVDKQVAVTNQKLDDLVRELQKRR